MMVFAEDGKIIVDVRDPWRCRVASLELPGRILYLCDDPALVAAQLAGRRLSRREAGALRDDVSTDEITPVRPGRSGRGRCGRAGFR
jgi:hypothetical protein